LIPVKCPRHFFFASLVPSSIMTPRLHQQETTHCPPTPICSQTHTHQLPPLTHIPHPRADNDKSPVATTTNSTQNLHLKTTQNKIPHFPPNPSVFFLIVRYFRPLLPPPLRLFFFLSYADTHLLGSSPNPFSKHHSKKFFCILPPRLHLKHINPHFPHLTPHSVATHRLSQPPSIGRIDAQPSSPSSSPPTHVRIVRNQKWLRTLFISPFFWFFDLQVSYPSLLNSTCRPGVRTNDSFLLFPPKDLVFLFFT